MKRWIVATCALVGMAALLGAQDKSPRTGGAASQAEPAAAAQARGNESGQEAGHRFYRPEQMAWKDGPPSLPPGAKFIVLEGDPAKAGFFAMRVKLPAGYRVPPHTHPTVERVTVVSGTFHLGTGEKADWDAMEALPAGSYATMPTGMKHYARTSGETVIQVATTGPWGITYVNPADDPRRKAQ
jgi:quercetin dioxygenase-like cupin family protein